MVKTLRIQINYEGRVTLIRAARIDVNGEPPQVHITDVAGGVTRIDPVYDKGVKIFIDKRELVFDAEGGRPILIR